MADTAALRGAVYSVLSGNDDFESLPFSTLRMEVEKSIGLSHGSLKSHKSEIMDLVVEFKHTRKYKKAAPRESESSEGAKGGKYSKRETELIMNTVEEYMTANGLTREDLCPALRNGTGYKHHSILWSMLHEALPNRLAKVTIMFECSISSNLAYRTSRITPFCSCQLLSEKENGNRKKRYY